jgi:hypothetical protein
MFLSLFLPSPKINPSKKKRVQGQPGLCGEILKKNKKSFKLA